MPLCTLHLLSLSTPLQPFLSALASLPEQPLVVSRVIRWVILPSTTSAPLLHHPWDVLVILPSPAGLPQPFLAAHARANYAVRAGVPSALVASFAEKNARLLRPAPRDVPPLTGALDAPRIATSAQNLELTDELRHFIAAYDPHGDRGAVSMLNLLAFRDSMHAEYLKYGKAFAESIGARRGGTAKIVGKVVRDGDGDGAAQADWDEVALAHYPSALHFADMAASEDYQAVNLRHRVPSLRDTCILMTSELVLDQDARGSTTGAKL